MKNLFLLLCITFFATVTYAQKLPNVQEKPLRAPANVKIDGKADEWTGLFQAKNSATELTYAISNDDENLYLVFQASVPEVQNKAMMTGIYFQINKNGKEDKNPISVAYPIFERRPFINWFIGPGLSADETAKKQDSLIQVANTKIAAAKSIKLHGIPSVDSVLSVYNEDGFKAAHLFNKQQIYTCEMAIPLKHLGLPTTTGTKFTYHVLLNGGTNKARMPVVYGAVRANGEAFSQAEMDAANARLLAAFATTDFWGEYSLAPKP